VTATEAKWKAHVEAWATSGLSVAAYAVKAGVHPGTLASWRSKLKSTQAADVGEPVKFVEIAARAVAEVAPTSGMIELLVGGAQIVIRGRVEVEALRSVIAVLEERR
jgi:transposase-like protein